MNEPVALTKREVVPPERADVLPPSQKSLPELADVIRKAHAEVIGAIAKGAEYAIMAGKALIEAKEQLRKQHGHGLWQDYIAVECRLGMRMAQRYMFLARHEDQLRQLLAVKATGVSFSSQQQAMKLLGVSRKKQRPKKKGPES